MWSAWIVLVFAFSGAVALATLMAAWGQRRSTPAARPILVCCAGTIVWAASAMLAPLFQRPGAVIPLATAVLIGECTAAFGFVLLAFVVRDSAWRPSRWTLLLAAEPLVAFGTAFANPWHHLFFTGVRQWRPGVWIVEYGPLFWLHFVVVYSALAIGTVGVLLAGRQPRGDARGGRWAVAIVAPGSIAYLLAMVLFDRYLDLALVGMAVSAATAYRAFSRESFEQLLPEARKKVLDTISDGVAVVDQDGRIIHLNPAGQEMVAKLLERPVGSANGLLITDALPNVPLDREADTSYTYNSVRGTDAKVDVRISVIRDDAGLCAGWTLVARDITLMSRQNRELEQANVRLQSQLEMIESLRADLAEQAVRDALTGLYNRRHLMAALEDLLRASECVVSVALVDLDHFKSINDTYGHGAGDDVLVEVTGILSARLAAPDILARYGGEEFVLVLPGLDVEEARLRVEEIRARVAGEPISAGGLTLAVTFSAGVAATVGPVAAADLIEAADRALYRAKNAGRNRVEVIDSRVSTPA